jgi:predicted RNase H-like nuclease (RuvC/YqgF family)
MVHPYKFQAIGDKLLDVLAVDPSDLIYMLINAVKELDAENQQLKARLTALEAEKEALAHRLFSYREPLGRHRRPQRE